MAKELAQTIGGKRIALLIAVLAAFLVLATKGEWFARQPLPSTTDEASVVSIIAPEGYQPLIRTITSTTGEDVIVGILVPEDQIFVERLASQVWFTGLLIRAMTTPPILQEVSEPSQPSLRQFLPVLTGHEVFALVTRELEFSIQALSSSSDSDSDLSVSIVGHNLKGVTYLLSLEIICGEMQTQFLGQEDGIQEAVAVKSCELLIPRWWERANAYLEYPSAQLAAVMSAYMPMTQPQDQPRL